MEPVGLVFQVTGINHSYQATDESDMESMNLNCILLNNTAVSFQIDHGPIFLNYCDKKLNITGLTTIVTVDRRPTRQEVLGIPSTHPWVSNQDPRDAIRIDGIEDGSDFAFIQVHIRLPDNVYDELKKVDLNARKVYLDIGFINTEKSVLPIDHPDFYFSYLNTVRVRIHCPTPNDMLDKN